jgi:Domain of unknown function (DUF4184)
MPFTPAHAAIVLPFIRQRWFSATALIIGSMAPDFEYFFKMSVRSEHSHTTAGLFYFDLPVTVALCLVFHLMVKRNLILNLPPFLQRRFQDTLELDFLQYVKTNWHIFLISAILGAASHLFWDNFTHSYGYFVQRFSFYDKTFPFQGVNYPMFYALQHISTAVGMTSIIILILLKRSQPAVTSQPTARYWLTVCLIIGGVLLIRFAIDSFNTNLGNTVISAISGFCLALILTGLFNFRDLTLNNRHGQEDTMGAGRKA